MQRVWKKIIVVLFVLFASLSTGISACSAAPVYELYPTQNMYNFLKLNTCDGRITKVQYSINEKSNRFERAIVKTPLVDETKARNGRFKLYPTENVYTFLLLDTINGRTWQVQWAFEPEKCGIIGEIK